MGHLWGIDSKEKCILLFTHMFTRQHDVLITDVWIQTVISEIVCMIEKENLTIVHMMMMSL